MANGMTQANGVVLWAVLLVGLVAAWQAASARIAPARSSRQLLIVADEPKPMDALAGFLRSRGKYEVRYVDQKDLPADLSQYAGVFMYVHGRMTRRTEKRLIDYTQAGGRMIILHHGVASARVRNPAWLRLTGIYIAPRNDPKHPWRVVGNTTHTLVNLNPRHYITSHKVQYDRTVEYQSSDSPSRPATYPALDLHNTEVFLNQHFTDGREKTVLFGFRCADGGKIIMQDRSGWLKPAGKGWVFYFQPGHCESDFRNRNYCQIILNCLTWKPGMKPAAEEPRVRPSPAAKKPA